MNSKEFHQNEKAIDYQLNTLGIPRNEQLANNSNVVYVHSYTRSDGTNVKAYYRSKAGGNPLTESTKNFGKQDSSMESLKKITNIMGNTLKKPIEINGNMIANYDCPDARGLLNIALVSPQNLPSKTSAYTVISPNHNKYFNDLFSIKGNKKIPDGWYGMVFSENSTLHQNLSNSQELKTQLKAYYNPHTGKFISNTLDVHFYKDKNLHRALGNATVFNPHIDNQVYFNAVIFDKYDFNVKEGKYKNNSFTMNANNYFAKQQDKGKISNFYYFVPVRIKW